MSNDECHTPDEFFKKLDAVFKFKLDAAATKKNSKCKKHITKRQNALVTPWIAGGNVFCNPPYSREAGGVLKWLQAAESNVAEGKCLCAVCLVICDVSTKARDFAWHNASEIVELSPRINFPSPGKKGRGGGLQAYQLVIFDNMSVRAISRWNWKDEDFIDRSEFSCKW